MGMIFLLLIASPSFSMMSEERMDSFDQAQLYREANQYEKAIDLYLNEIAKKGNLDPRWYSACQIGECYERLEQWDDALYWYLEAYQMMPNRGEPLVRISTHYRMLGYNDLAYIFAKFGSQFPLSKGQTSFDSYFVEPYRFEEELSIVAYYTQFKQDGYLAASNLVLKKNVPYSIREQTYRNLVFYAEPLPNASYQAIEMDLPLVKEGIRYHPMNPSILKTENGYTAICRVVNYTQKGARDFQSYDPKGIFRSRNFILQYDRLFNLLSQKELLDRSNCQRFGSPMVQGFEDCRIFEFCKAPWLTCTTTDTNPTGNFQISLCKLGDGIEHIIPLKGPDPYRCEKNWLPFVSNEKFHVIYQYDPFMIYTPDPETGDSKCSYSYQPKNDFSSFRGSAGPISLDNGYLILVHEVAFLLDGQRVYMHRFLFLNRDWVVERISKPFIFKHTGVEYCCSMSFDHSGEKIILPIGIEDKEAFFCSVGISTIRAMLYPLPQND